jgi:hypothetical protein
MTESVNLDDMDKADETPHLAAIPTYPIGAIPGPLAALIRSGQQAGLPAAYVAAAGLVALSYTALDCRIQVSDTWVEPATLWVPLLGGAGTAKSPGMRYGWRPIREHEKGLGEKYRRDIEAWLAVRAGKPKKEQPQDPKPPNPRRVVGDITTEKLTRSLAAGPKCAVVDELRTWLGGLGRYGGGNAAAKDLGFYLTSWDGGSVSYDRVTDDISIHIEQPVVPIIGTLQDEHHKLLGDVASGFRARWLPHLGPAVLPRTRVRQSDAPTEWESALTALLAGQPATTYHLEGAARDIWNAARDRWQDEAQDAAPGVRAALAKADRQALRVALALAVSIAHDGPVVPADAMKGAVAIVDYAMDCWRALPEGEALTLTRAEAQLMPAVDTLAAWLERRPDRRATRRDVLLAHVAGARTADQLDALLAQYEDVYSGSVLKERTGERGPEGIVVHAPRRSATRHTPSSNDGQEGRRETVAGNSFSSASSGGSTRRESGHARSERTESARGERSTPGNSFSGNSSGGNSFRPAAATDSDTSRPCRTCGRPQPPWLLDTRDGQCIDCHRQAAS